MLLPLRKLQEFSELRARNRGQRPMYTFYYFTYQPLFSTHVRPQSIFTKYRSKEMLFGFLDSLLRLKSQMPWVFTTASLPCPPPPSSFFLPRCLLLFSLSGLFSVSPFSTVRPPLASPFCKQGTVRQIPEYAQKEKQGNGPEFHLKAFISLGVEALHPLGGHRHICSNFWGYHTFWKTLY